MLVGREESTLDRGHSLTGRIWDVENAGFIDEKASLVSNAPLAIGLIVGVAVSLLQIVTFFLILLVGYIYIWRKGVLDWGAASMKRALAVWWSAVACG